LRKRLLWRPPEQAAEQAAGIGSAMAYNFLACDRDQAFLLPPDLRDWLLRSMSLGRPDSLIP
jgi:hypothetical protein